MMQFQQGMFLSILAFLALTVSALPVNEGAKTLILRSDLEESALPARSTEITAVIEERDPKLPICVANRCN